MNAQQTLRHHQAVEQITKRREIENQALTLGRERQHLEALIDQNTKALQQLAKTNDSQGKPVTRTALAKHLRISRQALYDWLKQP